MNQNEKRFIEKVYGYYNAHGRHTLPWRKTKDPYKILVSEIMLQQTQVDRVIPKYRAFLKTFPTVQHLAQVTLGEVLREWQGLGYNRRAKMLHQCAQMISSEYGGKFPKTRAELIALPGIGAYTAGAVLAFAYNIGVPIVETNIRTVYIHHFFSDEVSVSDADILKILEKTLDTNNAREWYYALMDYGSYLKKREGNQNVRSKHYTKQTPFKNSDRQIRGMILKELSTRSCSRKQFHARFPFESDRIDAQLERLKEEQMIVVTKDKYTLP